MRYKRVMTETRSSNLLAWLAAAARAVALLGFTLPWLDVTVGGRRLVSATGLELSAGRVVVRFPILGTVEGHAESLALPAVAGVLLAGALAAGLVMNRRGGARAGLILSAMSALVIAGFVAYGIYVHLPLPPEQLSLIERVADTIVRETVHVRAGSGFWLSMTAMIAAMLLDFTNFRGAASPAQSD
jgi:hypothetical protein